MRTPTVDNPLKILALGAGVQSSYLFLASAAGELPKLDAAIFADTRYEPKAVYTHLDWLETVGASAGIPIIRCTVGDLREDALDFRQDRVSRDGKRYASIPFYVKNPDGTRGQIRRQCTGSYKIGPMERVIREQFMSLRRGQRAPKECMIEHWLGISFDEAKRCSHPGVWKSVKKYSECLFGEKILESEHKKWKPTRWKTHAYPLCRWRFTSDRQVLGCDYLPSPMNRIGCEIWIKRRYPGRHIPRSACIGCPYRSNVEWRKMRSEDPESWQDAIEFDREIRRRDKAGQINRKVSIGLPFVHDSLVPLEMADIGLDDGKVGAGCGIQTDVSGINEGMFAGLCGN